MGSSWVGLGWLGLVWVELCRGLSGLFRTGRVLKVGLDWVELGQLGFGFGGSVFFCCCEWGSWNLGGQKLVVWLDLNSPERSGSGSSVRERLLSG